MMKSIKLLLILGALCAIAHAYIPEVEEDSTVESEVGDPSSPDQMYNILKKNWEDNVIPIYFDKSYPFHLKKKILAAMDVLNKQTCLKLREIYEEKGHYAKVIRMESGCFSALGFSPHFRGYQRINLHTNCFYGTNGAVLHELMHTIGIHHEQRRIDRDPYIFVHHDRIQEGKHHNFNKQRGPNAYLSNFGLPYDYNSIMHYAVNFFLNTTEPSLSVTQDFDGYLGQHLGLSRKDVAHVNRRYHCVDHYLGDDITGALPYEDFYSTFMDPRRIRTKRAEEWEANIFKEMEEGAKKVKRIQAEKDQLKAQRGFDEVHTTEEFMADRYSEAIQKIKDRYLDTLSKIDNFYEDVETLTHELKHEYEHLNKEMKFVMKVIDEEKSARATEMLN